MVHSQKERTAEVILGQIEELRQRYRDQVRVLSEEVDQQVMVLMTQAEESKAIPPKGTWVSIATAARNHELHYETVRRWVDYGWVEKHPDAEKVNGKACLIDEHDVVTVLFNRPTNRGPAAKPKG